MKYIKKYENSYFEDVESIDGFEKYDIVKFKPGYKDYADDSSIRIGKQKISSGIYEIVNLFIYKHTSGYATIRNIITDEEFDRKTSDMILAKDYEINAIKYNL